jgi:transposase
MISLDEYLEIQQLCYQGLSKSEIARRMGLDRKTVRKYLKKTTGPPVVKSRCRSSLLDGFKDYLRKFLILLKKLKTLTRAQGYLLHLTTLKQSLVKLFDYWIVLRCSKSRHI